MRKDLRLLHPNKGSDVDSEPLFRSLTISVLLLEGDALKVMSTKEGIFSKPMSQDGDHTIGR